MASSTALAFEHVTKRYGRGAGVTALDDVTWSIPIGARACLLGPNGAGKSTSIRLLQGAIRPTSGHASLLGAEADSPNYLAARRKTGIVPHSPGMYADLTVREFLRLSQRLYGAQSSARVVEVFGLGEQLGKTLAQLSGGYQRRLVLASALIGEPELLLLDEPTVGLDPLAAHDVHAYLREAMRNRTTLLCTHNLAEAEALCDEVIILRGGRVLVQESLEDLRGQGQRPALLLRARQDRTVLLQWLQEREHTARFDESDGVLVSVGDPTTAAPDLLRSLLAAGIDVFECRPVRPSLEEMFLDVVRGA